MLELREVGRDLRRAGGLRTDDGAQVTPERAGGEVANGLPPSTPRNPGGPEAGQKSISHHPQGEPLSQDN